MFPEMSTTEPNSPTARANASATPERIAGRTFGRTMRRKIVNRDAPSAAAASSISRSSSRRTGCTVRTTNGRVTNRSAIRSAQRVNAAWTCTGLRGPYKLSSVRLATIVGSANGRSITALTADWPKKRSRTSVQATAVPATACTAATASETSTVSFSAARPCASVTARHEPCQCAAHTSAASGSRTTTLRYATLTPTASPAPGLRRAPGSGSATDLAAKPSLDRGHDARVRVEELLLDLRPAPDIADREQLLRVRETRLRADRLQDRSVTRLSEQRLRLFRVKELDERVRLGGVLRRLRDGDRILDQDRRLRRDPVHRLALVLGEDGFVLVRQEDVAAAGEECLQRFPRARRLRHDVLLEQLRQIRERLLRRLARSKRGAVGGHHVPPRSTGCEGVRRDHLHTGLQEVAPRPDAL